MDQPRISVITTCHNDQRFIERTLCSVIDQGYDELEYIVVDRGSTDETGDLINLYKDDLIWLSEPNITKTEAINRGIERATGQWITIVEDRLLPGALFEAVARLRETDAAWLVGQTWLTDDDDFELGLIAASAPPSFASFLMHDKGVLPLAGAFFKRELFAEFGGFDAGSPAAVDYEFACRLLAAGVQPEILGRPLSALRQSEVGNAASLVATGFAYIATARRFAHHLPRREQVALWRNCDQRQRIYTLAEIETHPRDARRKLWQHLHEELTRERPLPDFPPLHPAATHASA